MQLPHLNPTCTQIQASRNLNIYKKKKVKERNKHGAHIMNPYGSMVTITNLSSVGYHKALIKTHAAETMTVKIQ